MPDSASVLSDFLKLSAQEQRDVLHGLVASGGDVNQELWQSFSMLSSMPTNWPMLSNAAKKQITPMRLNWTAR